MVLNRTQATVDLRLTSDELSMLRGALNEVCNGVHIDDAEFATRLGWDRETLIRLLTHLRALRVATPAT